MIRGCSPGWLILAIFPPTALLRAMLSSEPAYYSNVTAIAQSVRVVLMAAILAVIYHYIKRWVAPRITRQGRWRPFDEACFANPSVDGDAREASDCLGRLHLVGIDSFQVLHPHIRLGGKCSASEPSSPEKPSTGSTATSAP